MQIAIFEDGQKVATIQVHTSVVRVVKFLYCFFRNRLVPFLRRLFLRAKQTISGTKLMSVVQGCASMITILREVGILG